MNEKTFTQAEVNEITNMLYIEYMNMFKADKLDYKDLVLVENVIMKIQMKIEDKVMNDE